ncbi:MAG: glycine--tRNA ligase subunit beta, partial [Betaproteobacteria bacterium]
MNANLLVELFTEELPPKALKRLGDAFAQAIAAGLAARGLAGKNPGIDVYATPRRLGVKIADVLDRAPDRAASRKLMPAKVAYGADGKPTAALLKRLEKDGGSVEQLERKTDGNAEYVFLNQVVAGASLQAGLQTALDDAVAKLPIPKVMGYQLADGATTVQFVRPAHG